MPDNNYGAHHATYDRERKYWKVERECADRATSRHQTEQEAIDAARVVSRNQGTELFTHNKDGTVSERDVMEPSMLDSLGENLYGSTCRSRS